jgi:hypothetical protein
MAKNMTDAMIDGGLTKMNTSTRITVLSGEPTSISDITTAHPTGMQLATTSLTGGDFTLANGDVSGRKSTVAQKTGVSITATGTANHVAIDDGTDWIVTTCTSQALTSGGTVTIPAWKREIADAT